MDRSGVPRNKMLRIKIAYGNEIRRFDFVVDKDVNLYNEFTNKVKNLWQDINVQNIALYYTDEDGDEITFNSHDEIICMANSFDENSTNRVFAKSRKPVLYTPPAKRITPSPSPSQEVNQLPSNTLQLPLLPPPTLNLPSEPPKLSGPYNNKKIWLPPGYIQNGKRCLLFRIEEPYEDRNGYLSQRDRDVFSVPEPNEDTVWVPELIDYDSRIHQTGIYVFYAENRPNQHLREDPALDGELRVGGGRGKQSRFKVVQDDNSPFVVTLISLYRIVNRLPIIKYHKFHVYIPEGIQRPKINVSEEDCVRFVCHPDSPSMHGGFGKLIGINEGKQIIIDAHPDDPSTKWKIHCFGKNKVRIENVSMPGCYMRMSPDNEKIDVRGGKNTKRAAFVISKIQDSKNRTRIHIKSLTIEGKAIGVINDGVPYSSSYDCEEFFLFPGNFPFVTDLQKTKSVRAE